MTAAPICQTFFFNRNEKCHSIKYFLFCKFFNKEKILSLNSLKHLKTQQVINILNAKAIFFLLKNIKKTEHFT